MHARTASSSCCAATTCAIAGAEVVVVGRGVTVGRPLGLLLTRRSENATVTLCHTGTARPGRARARRPTSWSPRPACPASSPATWSSPAPRCSTSASPGSTASSPATSPPTCWDVAGWVSPNPGGVGPMTRAMLLSNIVTMAEQARCRPVSEPDPPEPSRAVRGARGRRPERRYPSTIGGAFYLVVLGRQRRRASAIVCRSRDWRLGVRVVAVGLLVAAGAAAGAARSATPGMLAVRHRLVDVARARRARRALFVLAEHPGPAERSPRREPQLEPRSPITPLDQRARLRSGRAP